MKKNKKLIIGALVVVIIGLLVWYFMRQKEEEQIDPLLRTDLTGNGNGSGSGNGSGNGNNATPTPTNPCDNMDGRKPGGHRWKCAEGRRRGLIIPTSANLRGYPEGNILAWMYHIKYESSWANRNSMSMKELAEAASYQRMKQLGDG